MESVYDEHSLKDSSHRDTDSNLGRSVCKSFKIKKSAKRKFSVTYSNMSFFVTTRLLIFNTEVLAQRPRPKMVKFSRESETLSYRDIFIFFSYIFLRNFG
jgi:hypothetical protein